MKIISEFLGSIFCVVAALLSALPGDVQAPSAQSHFKAPQPVTKMQALTRASQEQSSRSQVQLARQVECIGSAMWHEARNQPQKGIVAVGEVIVARSKDPRYPSTPCEVVSQDGQFAFVRDGRIPALPRDAAGMRETAKRILANQVSNPVKGAMFFRLADLPPEPGREFVVQIGDHSFYR